MNDYKFKSNGNNKFQGSIRACTCVCKYRRATWHRTRKKIKVCANESRYPRAHTGCPRISWMPPGRLESTTNRDEFLIFPSLCAEKKTPFPQGWLNCADFRYDDSAGRFESGRGSELEITLSRYKERKREKRRGRSMESPAVQNARGD